MLIYNKNNNNGKNPVKDLSSLSGSEVSQLPADDRYKMQLENYKNWKGGYRNPDKYNYRLSPSELGSYISSAQKRDANFFASTGLPTELWVNKNNYSSSGVQDFFPQYEKPIMSNTNAYAEPQQGSAPAVGTRYYRHPNTNEVLDPKVYGTFQGVEDKQLAQAADMMILRNRDDDAGQKSQIAKNKELLKNMTSEQLADMRARKLTPSSYMSLKSGGVLYKKY
jgi:hypothetical protein